MPVDEIIKEAQRALQRLPMILGGRFVYTEEEFGNDIDQIEKTLLILKEMLVKEN